MKKINIQTLGCNKNQIDSEIMLGKLESNGYIYTHDISQADYIIVNTCGFIEDAKKESIETILGITEYKKDKCNAVIITGCLSQRYSKELAEEIPEIDIFLGTTNFDTIVDAIEKFNKNKKRNISIGDINDKVDYNQKRSFTETKSYEYLKIAEGCDNKCTYCIIPKLRGSYKSRKIEDIIDEAHNLVNSGVKEINLIAQDITRYGKDLYGEYRLTHLLKELSKIEKLEWIRLLYAYPDLITDELVTEIKENPKVCKYIDIPLQHINDRILKQMNRHVKKSDIINVIDKLRKNIPDITIRTTFIVGFPSETKEEFDELLNFISDHKFDKVGVFTYSEEENTPAAKMSDQIDDTIKEERKDMLMNIQMNISSELLIRKIGSVQRVMITEQHEEGNYCVGRSMYDAPEIDGEVIVNKTYKLNVGEFYNIKILDAYEYDLGGEVC